MQVEQGDAQCACMRTYVCVCVLWLVVGWWYGPPCPIMHAMIHVHVYTNDSVYGVGVHGCAGGVIGPVLVHHAVEALQWLHALLSVFHTALAETVSSWTRHTHGKVIAMQPLASHHSWWTSRPLSFSYWEDILNKDCWLCDVQGVKWMRVSLACEKVIVQW